MLINAFHGRVSSVHRCYYNIHECDDSNDELKFASNAISLIDHIQFAKLNALIKNIVVDDSKILTWLIF